VLFLRELSIDFAGFIFVPGTPRFQDIESVQKLTKLLPPDLRSVGVFLDEEPAKVRKAAEICGLDILQFHGRETPEYCSQFGLPYFKVIRITGAIDVELLTGYHPEAFLLDTFSKENAGGTGRTFDWTVARRVIQSGTRVILAGGLNPKNVARAIREVHPWGVDVSSGVEIAPGVKDHDKMRQFIEAARS